jgi:hypothetical protein
VAVAPDRKTDDEDAAEQLTRDGVRPLLAGEPLDAHGTRALLSSARHELGSPLQSIQGFAELLASEAFGALSQEQHGFLEHILAASSELRGAMDACLALAELELVGCALNLRAADLHTTLLDVQEQAQRQLGVVIDAQPGVPRARVKLDVDLFRRAFETLLLGLSARDGKSFVVAIDSDAEYARVSVARATLQARAATSPVATLAAREDITRNLLWFRLAAALFAAQDLRLSVAERLDYAEVHLRLTPTH